MISTDYLEEFNSPIRQIQGKAELFTSSTFSQSGNGVRLGLAADTPVSIGVSTVNLLNLKGREASSFSNAVNTAKREFEYDKYYVGIAFSNYSVPSNIASCEVTENSVTVTRQANSGYGVGFPVKVKPNTQYRLYAETKDTNTALAVSYYAEDGSYIDAAYNADVNNNITTPNGCVTLLVIVEPKNNTEPQTTTNLVLVEGRSNKGIIPYIDVNESNPNLWESGELSDYYVYSSGTKLQIEEDGISGILGTSGTNYIYNLNKHYSPGRYNVTFWKSVSMAYRWIVRCYDSNGNILTNSNISMPGWTYNTHYKGFFAYSLLNEITIPDTVSYWVLGFVFTTDNGAYSNSATGYIGQRVYIKNICVKKANTGADVLTYNGKNISYYDTFDLSTGYKCTSGNSILYRGYMASPFVLSFRFNTEDEINISQSFIIVYRGATSTAIRNIALNMPKDSTGRYYIALPAYNEDIRIAVVNWGAQKGIITDIQIEFGETLTDYEPPVFPTRHSPIEGKLEYETKTKTTTFIADGVGAIITETHKGDEVLDDFTHDRTLQSIEIERQGEKGKFFGFGIPQKATIKLTSGEIINDKKYFFKLLFDINENNDINNFPDFYIADSSKDENTGVITVTAEDLLFAAGRNYVSELGLTAYTIREFAEACADFYSLTLDIKGMEDQSSFDLDYPEGANFEGTETIRSALNAIAEVTQTIYYISGKKLIFKRLNSSSAADLTIEKQHYFTLTSGQPHMLGAVCHATQLGDNIISPSIGGETQYVRDNPFWELREDVPTLVESAAAAMSGLTIVPFECSWRGNFLLEPGDKISLTAKDNTTFISYVLNDTISYTGGYSQKTDWEYTKEEETASNPSTLGDVIKQTYAKVDKINKEVTIVASEIDDSKTELAQLQITTSGINNTVAEEIEGIKKQGETYLTKDEFNVRLQEEGVGGQNFKFNREGLRFTDINPNSNKEVETLINNEGMQVFADGEEKLSASDEGVNAVDLRASTYLIIGKNSRFEDYNGNRTGCFWIGG